LTPTIQPGDPKAPNSSADPKDMDSFRKMEDSLTSQINTLGLLRLGVILILIILFGSGIKKQNDATIETLITQITDMQDEYNTGPIDPLGRYLTDVSNFLFNNDTVSAKSSTQTSKDSATLNADEKKLEGLIATLSSKYRETFLTKVSILGTDLSFDLRTLIVTLPFWLPLFQLYRHILIEKRRILRALAAAKLQRTDATTAIVDCLTFSRPRGAFVSFPDVLTDRLFWILVAVLVAFVLIIISPSHLLTKGITFLILEVLFATLLYSRAYASFASERMRLEAEEMFNVRIPAERFIRIWNRCASILVTLRRRLPAGLTLAGSAVFIFMTLFLNTAEVGCNNQASPAPASSAQQKNSSQQTSNAASDDDTIVPRRGYQILTGHADWPPSVETGWIGLFGFDDQMESTLGRAIYFVLLAMSLLALLLGLSSWLRRRFPLLLLRLLRSVAVLISVLLICEFSGPTFLPFSFWLLPFTAALIVLLLLLVLRSRAATRAKLRKGLVIALIPLVFSNLLYLGRVFTVLYGLSVLYFAAHALTLGFVLLLDHRRPSETAPNPSEAPSA
jgi:hypothetical protein